MYALEVVLGLLLVILFYSLFATVIMEFLAGMLSLRGKHLKKTLKLMLNEGSENDESVLRAFMEHPLYQQLSGKAPSKDGTNHDPSYLGATDFRTILLSTLQSSHAPGKPWTDRIAELEDGPLKQLLEQFWEEGNRHTTTFIPRVEKWYDDVMDRASGWYKRKVQKLLLVVGLVIAVIFNADVITIFSELRSSSGDELARLALVAEQLSGQQATVVQINLDSLVANSNGVVRSPTAESALFQELQAALEIDKDPLGIGWEPLDTYPQNAGFWGLKFFGWLLMAFCIAKGAPFWFDLLKKIVSFRSTGELPDKLIYPTPPVAAPNPDVTVTKYPGQTEPVG